MEKRLRVCFSGTVQGVGFRYTTERLARRRAITGYVRNLAAGTVEVAAEGEESELQLFFADIQGSRLRHYIRDVAAEWSASRREFQTFSVRF